MPTLAHLTCVSSTKETVHERIQQMKEAGIKNVMALRGDLTPELENSDRNTWDYRHAVDLIRELKEEDFCIGGACYPEIHPESTDQREDILHLKEKVDAGADYIVTQMFFDNNKFYDFVRQCRAAGITVPIIPGLKPISTQRQLGLLPRSFHLDIPEDLVHALHQCATKEDAYQVGIEWCIAQSKDLLSHGAPAIHYYTMGKARNVVEIVKQVF